MEKPKVYRESFLLRTCDCDFTGFWRPSAILTAMQEAAGAHSHFLGCGRDDLIKNDIVWVVNRAEVRMKRYPKVMETVTVETFPAALRRWFFPRYYVFRDAQGEEIGCAGTLWALLNLTERRMAPPGDVALTIPDNSDLRPPMGLPAGVDLVAGEEQVTRRMPAYFDLDVNQHVNNTRYVDWACDALGVDLMRDCCLQNLRVSYAAEVRADQEIALHVTRDGMRCRVAGYHGDTLHFEMGADLAKREPENS